MAKNRTRRGSPLHITPSFELFGQSRDIVLKNIWIFGPLYAIPMIFSIHAWLWAPSGPNAPHHWWGNGPSFAWNTSALPSYAWYTVVGFSTLWFLIVIVGGTIVQIMSQAAQLEASEGKQPTFDRLWATVKELGWRMVGLYIVVLAYVIVGLILLIIPGLIMIRRYFLSPYIMLEKKVSITEAMEQSAKMSKPHSGSIWGVIGVMFLIALTGIIPFIGWLISFILGMFYAVAPALRYQELKKFS